MGVFEDVVVNAKSAVTTVSKKAGKLVDISKLRLNATELNNEISKRYEALGRVVYDAAKEAQDVSGLIEECVISIDALYLRLDEVNDKISTLQSKVVCPNCGFSNEESSLFCSQCGAALPDLSEDESDKEPIDNDGKAAQESSQD